MEKIPVLVGPTSSGKTSLAVSLARKFGGEIISADSRQIFKQMNIGTGKVPVEGSLSVQNFVTYWTLEDVIVHGYDLINPDEFFSVFDYGLWATKKIAEIENKRVFVVGGTGFYIDALTGRSSVSNVAPNLAVRSELENLSIEELGLMLQAKNNVLYDSIDKKNKRRLVRALEIELNSSPTNSAATKSLEISSKGNEFFYIGLTAPREILYSRVDAWVDCIWQNGLIEETQSLITLGYEDSRPMNGIVYKTVKAFLAMQISESECVERIKFDLHSYIRRQQTWFKRNEQIHWFDISDTNFTKMVFNHVESVLYG